ncbi:hypothetical protein MSHOH_2618 [Methanosarcina horonobensis HB-1 = JCM 15518]|uniref:Uncharacterized protein n=1 Tax=Methanosarcina horonobensis HB-1 = JCM 15518 TaxID=1434110 RepID=A0A0E3SDY6_9EURY|nr:hypothetical protein [Methanosarcina horonobensis]AKB79101.1 hypothetical protein MSHOH_2618 [Methanosarcina horonobensis HB-1 = JCM 15518]
MFDLSEEQITAFSLYSAVNESILPLPGTMKFLDTFCKHSASRERQGRKELVELATPHPISPLFWPRGDEVQDSRTSGGLFSKIGGLFKKPKRGETVNDAKPERQ